MNVFHRLKEWYSGQSSNIKAYLWLGVILVIGIIIRWDYIIGRIAAGFGFFTK